MENKEKNIIDYSVVHGVENWTKKLRHVILTFPVYCITEKTSTHCGMSEDLINEVS